MTIRFHGYVASVLVLTTLPARAEWRTKNAEPPNGEPHAIFLFENSKSPFNTASLYCNSKGGIIYQFGFRGHSNWSGVVVTHGKKTITVKDDLFSHNITEDADKFERFIDDGLKTGDPNFAFKPEHIAKASSYDPQGSANMSEFRSVKQLMYTECQKIFQTRPRETVGLPTAPAKRDIRGATLGMTRNQLKSVLSEGGAKCSDLGTKSLCFFNDGQDQNGLEVDFNPNDVAWKLDYVFHFQGSPEQLKSFFIKQYNLRPLPKQGQYILGEDTGAVFQTKGNRGRFLIMKGELENGSDRR